MTQDITIRNAWQLDHMGEQLKEALLQFCKSSKDKTLPLIYQHLHKPDDVITEEYIKEHTIADVSNIHFDEKTKSVIGTVSTRAGSAAVFADPTSVDNIMATIPAAQAKVCVATVKALITYNLAAKKRIDTELSHRRNQIKIPIVSDPTTQTAMFKADQNLVEQFKKLAETELENKEDNKDVE